MPPLVSVIIPVYNTGRFAAEAIESALAQTYPRVEIIVVDDGSLEPTEWLVKRFAGRIAYYAKPNGGPASARNLGIARSRGELVAFLDADDLWEPHKLAEQAAAMERHPETGLVYTAMAKIDRAGYPLDGEAVVERRPSGRVLTALFMRNIIPTSTVLVHRDCLDAVGLFDEALPVSEDYDLWLRISERYEVAYVPQRLARYRVHPAGISRDPVRAYECEQRVVERAVARFGDRYPELRANLRRRLGRLFFEYGYEFFSQEEFAEAGRQSRASLRHWPADLKVCVYAVASALGEPVVSAVRRLRRRAGSPLST